MIDIKRAFEESTGHGAEYLEHEVIVRVSFTLQPEGRRFTLTASADEPTVEGIQRAAIKLGQLAATTRQVLAQPDGPGQVTHD